MPDSYSPLNDVVRELGRVSVEIRTTTPRT